MRPLIQSLIQVQVLNDGNTITRNKWGKGVNCDMPNVPETVLATVAVSQKTPHHFSLSHNTTTIMSNLNTYLNKEEAELGIVGQTMALNLEADADMMSAKLENVMEALDPELSSETVQEWAQLPDNGNDGLLLTTDQLTLVAESVWQQIGHQLDAKQSQDSNECNNALDELTELQGKFSELSDKYKMANAKIISLRREQDAL